MREAACCSKFLEYYIVVDVELERLYLLLKKSAFCNAQITRKRDVAPRTQHTACSMNQQLEEASIIHQPNIRFVPRIQYTARSIKYNIRFLALI